LIIFAKIKLKETMERAVLVERIQKKIASIQKKDLLEELQKTVDEMLVADKDQDFWNELTDLQKKNIEISLGQIEKGQVSDNEVIRQKARTWLKK
jgi:hypothetical protein